jgi:hypothetical protein
MSESTGGAKKPCGAATRTCECGHHRKRHVDGLGACQEKRCKCKTFQAKRCKDLKVYPNGRCRKHGGASLVGPASPSFKHGRYSKLLPGNLAHHYEVARQDPDLVSLRSELALIDARAAQIIEQLQQGEAGALWRRLKAARDRLQTFRKDKKLKEMGAALEELFTVIEQGVKDADAWTDLLEVTELRRRLVESQSRRERDLKQTVGLSELMALMGAIAASVHRHVTDRNAATAVSNDLRRLLGPNAVIDAEPAQN